MNINPNNVPWCIWIFSRLGSVALWLGVPLRRVQWFVGVGVRCCCIAADVLNFPEGQLREHIAAYRRSAPPAGEPRIGFTVRFILCSLFSTFVLLPCWMAKDFGCWLLSTERFVNLPPVTSPPGENENQFPAAGFFFPAAASRARGRVRSDEPDPLNDSHAADCLPRIQNEAAGSVVFPENTAGRVEGCEDASSSRKIAPNPRRSSAKGLSVIHQQSIEAMKTTLTLLLLLAAQFAIAQTTEEELLLAQVAPGGGGTYSLRFVARTTAGNSSVTTNTIGSTLFVIFLQGYTTDPTFSDDQGNTPTYRIANGGSGTRIRLAEVVNPNTNASHTFTVGDGDGVDYRNMIVLGYSGNAGSPYDTSTSTNVGNWGSAGDNGILAGQITPAQANEQVVAGLTHTIAGTVSIDSGFTVLASSTNTQGYFLHVAHKSSVSAATNPKWTTTAASDGGAAINGAWK